MQRSRKLPVLGVVVLLLGILSLPVKLRGAAENLFVDTDGAAVWHLQAEEFTYDGRRDTYTARGNACVNLA